MHLPGKILKDSLFKNAIFLIFSQLSNLSTGFIFWIIAAKFYTPSDIGMISALISAMLLLGIINNLGFSSSLLIFLPSGKENAKSMINSCITVSTLVSFAVSFIFVLGLGFWAISLAPVLKDLKYIILFILITAASNISGLINFSLIAGRRSSFQTMNNIFFGIIKILPLAVFASFGAIGIFISWGIGVLLSILLGIIILPKVWPGYRPSFALDPVIRKMASVSAGNYLAGIFSSLSRLVLPLIIANTISTEAAGYFYIAMLIAGLLFGIPQAISNSLMAESSNSTALWKNVRKSIKFSFLLIIPGILLFILMGRYVLHLFNPVYGENSYLPMVMLSLASIPLAVITIYNAVRNFEKRIKSVIFINALTALVTLGLAFPLMKIQGITGASAAFLAGNVISAGVVILMIRNPKEFILFPGKV